MQRLKTIFRSWFLTGIIVTVPIAISVFVLWHLFTTVDGWLSPIIVRTVGRHIPGLGVIAGLVIVLCAGVVATNVVGRRMISMVEGRLLRIPLFKSFYATAKAVVDAVSPTNKTAFRHFVIVQYPKSGTYAFGFLTRECRMKTEHSEEMLDVVYLPMNHIYVGDIGLFRQEDVIYTDLTVEEGIRIVLSSGLSTPAVVTKIRRPESG